MRTLLHAKFDFMEWLVSEFWEIKCTEDKSAFYECFAVVTKKKSLKFVMKYNDIDVWRTLRQAAFAMQFQFHESKRITLSQFYSFNCNHIYLWNHQVIWHQMCTWYMLVTMLLSLQSLSWHLSYEPMPLPMPVHLKPGGHCCGGGAGQHLGRAAVGEHVKAEWRLECCDNREFIVSVLSLLSNVILTSERAQVRSSLDTVRRGAREICYELDSIRRWTNLRVCSSAGNLGHFLSWCRWWWWSPGCVTCRSPVRPSPRPQCPHRHTLIRIIRVMLLL